MSVFKQFWQNLFQRLRPPAPWSVAEIERELADARQEREHLLSQLVDLKSELGRGVSAARKEQEKLLSQLQALHVKVEEERSAASLERQALHEEQQGLQEQLNANQAEVERSFVAARQERQALRGELGKLQGELEQRFEQLRVERDAANEELVALRTSLADAGARQEAADTRVHSLEIGLNEQRQEHDVARQQALIRERRLRRRLTAAMMVAAAAFVLGVVGGAINFWQVKNSARLLGEVSQGIREIQATIAGQSSADVHGPSPQNTPAVPENGDTSHVSNSSPTDAASTPPKRENSAPGFVGERLPEPDFVASKSLPAGNYRFKRRQDASAFLRENAKQPGVVTLPSGLQYRELIPGTGKKPGTDDKVVIEYRAFRPDGTETDNSFNADVPKTLAVNEAFPGLKEALLHMREGAQWELYIPAKLVYRNVRKRGPYGYEPRILTVELVSVAPAEDSSQP